MSNIEKKYNKLFIKLTKYRENNAEEDSHILQDKIYRLFIKDICNNNMTLNDSKIIACNINKQVIKYDKNRWYS